MALYLYKQIYCDSLDLIRTSLPTLFALNFTATHIYQGWFPPDMFSYSCLIEIFPNCSVKPVPIQLLINIGLGLINNCHYSSRSLCVITRTAQLASYKTKSQVALNLICCRVLRL